jgi:hypothetical protein
MNAFSSSRDKMRADKGQMPLLMRNLTAIFAAGRIVACLAAMISSAEAASPKPSLEDRYIAARDAAIAKISPLYDGNFDEASKKIEEAARADLWTQMTAILGEKRRAGFGPPLLNIDTFYKGDEGFGMLDGLRFDAEFGASGEKAGQNGPDGNYVEPKAHILVTTQTLFERWLREHREWWDKGMTNVPQQIGAALRAESFYTQAISSGSAVINFNALPIAAPASTTLAYAMLAGRTQSEIPDDADEVFVSALSGGKVYIAYGSIEPKVRIPACTALRAGYNKRSTEANEKFQRKEIDKRTYDKLDNLRQHGEDAFKRCFTKAAPQQSAFAKATEQAESLLAAALGR